jgi:hypothetical protein
VFVLVGRFRLRIGGRRLCPDVTPPALVEMLPRTGTVGLCATCAFSRVIQNRRGSRFWLCVRSETDPSYPKYPPLPVVACRGFQDAERAAKASSAGRSTPPRH